MTAVAIPSAIQFHRQSRFLELRYPDGSMYQLPCEYLRVFSPSAEVRGHGLAEPMLVPGKRDVSIARVEPVGQYAVRLVFDDGHDTGLYSWEVLDALAREHEKNWARYLDRMQQAGMTRERDVVKLDALVQHHAPRKIPS